MPVLRMVLTVAMLTGAAWVLCPSAALATSGPFEYCPARVGGSERLTSAASTLYSFELRAHSARTVSGSIDVQTKAGWFTIPFTDIALTAGRVRYRTAENAFERTTAVSPELFARFPAGVTTASMWWVASARAFGDGPFGWAAKGTVACPPIAGLGIPDRFTSPDVAVRVSAARIDLSATPRPGDTVAIAQPIPAPLSTACRHPFTNARVIAVAGLNWPRTFRIWERRATFVEVAISAQGHVDGAWVYQPSGIEAFDLASLRSATLTEYAAGRAFCKPAPGYYLFVSAFIPR